MRTESWLTALVSRIFVGQRVRLRRKRRPAATSIEPLETRLVLSAVLGIDAADNLIRFDSAAPTVVTSSVPITGLVVGDTIIGIDFRPATGELFGLGSGSRLYVIDPTTGVATQRGTDGAFTLSGTAFGFDFNPVADRIRITSDVEQNIRVNPNNGTLAGVDPALTYAAGDVNEGHNPDVVGGAYTNDFAGATTTTLYGIDTLQNVLVRQGGIDVPPGSPSPNTGLLFTVNPLGINPDDATRAFTAFDIQTISNGSNVGLAAMTTSGTSSQLYSIDLGTGAATLIGNIGVIPTLVRGLAVIPAGAFTFSAPTYSVGESGPTATITINRVGGSEGVASVNFSTTNGTAVSPGDYVDADQTVIFASGQTSQNVTITINNDSIDEADETVDLSLSNPTGNAVIGTQAESTLTIVDDDAPPSLSINDVTVGEGNSGTVNAVFTVSLSAASGQTVTVNASTANGTAAAPGDYTAIGSQTVTFNPGETQKTVTVSVNGDTLDEVDQTFFVNLSGAANATIADGQGVGTIADDDSRMFRVYNPNAGLHVFTISRGEFDSLVALGYHDETSASAGFTVSAVQLPGTSPIHRLYNPNAGHHYLTLSDVERASLIAHGWNAEPDMGFMYAAATTGTTEIFHLYNINTGDHLYTASSAEVSTVLSNPTQPPPWVQQTSLGFAFAAAATGSAPPQTSGAHSEDSPPVQMGTSSADNSGGDDSPTVIVAASTETEQTSDGGVNEPLNADESASATSSADDADDESPDHASLDVAWEEFANASL